ncbi:MAG: thymidylate synthase [Armatimonadota bacterium]|nr:thymidylate synthase [Armatimonadota bacterium]
MTQTLPVISVSARTLPEAWENAVVRTWREGAAIATQYDKPGDPPSRDAIAVIVVEDSMAEPRIHRCFPGGIVELEAYRQEMVDGIHDHWVDPAAGKWEYTYHERLAAYSVPGLSEPIDQIERLTQELIKAPHTRRAQAITWKPWEDTGIADPACLQRLWFRVYGDELVLNAHMRSNDAFKAAFMNMYAFTDLQRAVAERLTRELGREIRPGQYTHIADSFHIYGSYFEEFEAFLKTLENRSFDQRVFSTEDVQDIIDEARQQIADSLEAEKVSGRKGL